MALIPLWWFDKVGANAAAGVELELYLAPLALIRLNACSAGRDCSYLKFEIQSVRRCPRGETIGPSSTA